MEKQHEKRYRTLLNNILKNQVFKKGFPVNWKSRNCGFVQEGIEAPEKGLASLHSQTFFEVLSEKY